MATSLAQQLKRLALPEAQAAAGVQTKQRKSLLFDPKEAAALDRETFYAVGERISDKYINFKYIHKLITF